MYGLDGCGKSRPQTAVQPVASRRTEHAIPSATLYMTLRYLTTPIRQLPDYLCTDRLTLQLHSIKSVPPVWAEYITI